VIVSQYCCAEMAPKRVKKVAESRLVPHSNPELAGALERAAVSGVSAMEQYLSAGGSTAVTVQVTYDGNSIHVALLVAVIINHHPEAALAIELLLKAGVDAEVTYTDCHGQERNAVMSAATCTCCRRPLETLLQGGANSCARSRTDGVTALHAAAQSGRYDKCNLVLLASGGKLLEARDSAGSTPLLTAAAHGHAAVVELLHKCGANITASDARGFGAMQSAAGGAYLGVLRYLISCQVNVNKPAKGGETPIHMAGQSGSLACVKLLLGAGADLHAVGEYGLSVLFTTAMGGHASVMQHLLSLGLDPNATSSGRETVLITACKGSHAQVAQLLLRAGAAVDAVDEDGCSALYHAAQCCSFAATTEKGQYVETARVLLIAGADVLRSPRCLHAAVHSLSSSLSQQVMALTQRAGAAAAGSAALAAAAASQADMVKLLLAHGAGVSSVLEATASSCSCCGDTTALQACTDAAALKLLLAAGASVQARTSKGNTCLHTAAAHGHSAPVICLLIKAGADLTAVNRSSKTAAQVARARGHKLAEALLNRAAQG
jgi:ankyrin repeat protein